MIRLRLKLGSLLAFAVLTLSLECPRAVAAEAPRVLLVRPPDAAGEVSAALVRVQGELVADGFDVVSLVSAPGTTSAMAMDQAETQAASTTVGLFLSADGKSAELWVVDRLTNKTVVRRVATAGEAQSVLPAVLASKAVELLRASLLELVVERSTASVETRAASPVAAQRASDWAARPLVPTPRWAIETGALAIWSPGQVDAAIESVARGRFAASKNWQIRLTFAGLGTHPQVRGSGGSAQIEQEYGLVEGLLVPWSKLVARPFFSLGAGTFRTTVKGEASWPYRGLSASHWAFVTDAGIGLGVVLASRLELGAEGHALWTTPEPIVRFVNDDSAHASHPGLACSLTLLGWL